VAQGRPPEGPKLADRLEGPDESKKRLRVILETISGQRSIADAASEIGVGAARFHELRQEVLQAALAALEPKPAGRPPSEAPASDPRVAELEAELKELTIEVKAAHVREQIALTMPHLLKRGDETADAEIAEIEGSKKRSSRVLQLLRQRKSRRRG
jgi:transposase-like protein